MVVFAAGLGCKDKDGAEPGGIPEVAAASASSAAVPDDEGKGAQVETLFHDPGEVDNVSLPFSLGGGYLAYEADGRSFAGEDRIMLVATAGKKTVRQVGPPSTYGVPKIDGDHVYYFDLAKARKGLWRASLAGGEPEQLTDGITGILVFAEDSIYVIDEDDVIWKISRAGGEVRKNGVIQPPDENTRPGAKESLDRAEAAARLMGEDDFAGRFATYADGKLYRIGSHREQVKKEDGRVVGTTRGWIDSVPLTGGIPEIVVDGLESPKFKLQIHGDYFYFAAGDKDVKHFWRAHRATGKVEKLTPIDTYFDLYRFKVVDDVVYASAFINECWLVRWKLDGSGFTRLSDDAAYTETLQFDDKFVYWAGDDDKFRRLPR